MKATSFRALGSASRATALVGPIGTGAIERRLRRNASMGRRGGG